MGWSACNSIEIKNIFLPACSGRHLSTYKIEFFKLAPTVLKKFHSIKHSVYQIVSLLT